MTVPVLPTIDEELWRYSRIGELHLDSFTLGEVETTTTGEFGGAVADVPLSSVSAETPDVFEQLNAEHGVALSITTKCGEVRGEPVVISRSVSRGGIVAYPTLVIDAAENSEVTVIERFTSADGIASLVVPMVKIRAAQSARVTYVSINELGRDTWMIGYQRAVGERDSSMSLSTVALGGDYARVRAGVRLVGTGASARQVALYLADGAQMHDFRTLQDHAAPRTHSDLLFKGAVKDVAKSVYTGLIHIRENAAKSEAFQTNRNLTLSHGAWAESVPNLNIETNDVKCSHASTVGPIDDDQRYYLESRGIPPEVAERLVVFGFFADVLDRLPAAAGVAELRRKVSDKLMGVHQ
jgi:Fe-S cluster assembly protein SufD